jgi:membrane-bound lytic murein transglycosylase A
MNRNRSFIFFAETGAPVPELGPVAAAAVQLTPGRSLAIDRTIHTFATPIFVSTRQPLAGHQTAFRRLMIAQDTGSAIIGVARGDLFIGSGQQAGEIAGAIRHAADFHVLMPAMAARSPGAAG